jgi:hypothetical protein
MTRSGVLTVMTLLIGWLTTAAAAELVVRSFEDDRVGVAPAGFSFAVTRQATPGQWLVRADGAAHHLAHLADPAAAGGLSIATLTGGPMLDTVRAAVRIRFGDGERVGGLVWRYQDPQNFYAATLDLQLQEIALYRIVNGNRIRLEREDDLELDPGAWHSVRVEHNRDTIRLALGGIGVIRTRDRALAGAGQVGLWSGGASTTAFDDLRVDDLSDSEERRRENPRR